MLSSTSYTHTHTHHMCSVQSLRTPEYLALASHGPWTDVMTLCVSVCVCVGEVSSVFVVVGRPLPSPVLFEKLWCEAKAFPTTTN